jgi:hypothetical protein
MRHRFVNGGALMGHVGFAISNALRSIDAAALRDYDAKVLGLVNVDDFAPHELGVDANQRQGAREFVNAAARL